MSDAVPTIIHFDGPRRAKTVVALAHGAGAGMDTPFMDYFAQQLAAGGIRVARFEFPYMLRRRQTGGRRPPDRADRMMATWLDVISQLSGDLFIGGKSMGGRLASMVADESFASGSIRGLICLGYPFHPPGKPEALRVDHLQTLSTPTLICQGERDTFGNRLEVETYPLSSTIALHWLPDGDHGFKPRKNSGWTETENWESAVKAISAFCLD